MNFPFRMRLALASLSLIAAPALAAPQAQPGDVGLRHDIQVLADYGAISGPVTTWPISWDAVLADLERVKAEDIVLPNRVLPTFERILAKAQRETARGRPSFNVLAAGAEAPTNIRGFANTPREKAELKAGVSWFSDHVSLDLKVAGVSHADVGGPSGPISPDTDNVRADGSQLGVNLGNWSIAASTYDRWWGPGWDGSLVLSNNARPIPSLVIGRNLTTAPTPNWLRWIGPWDLQVMLGQLEKERVVPDARFLGLRFNFRPLRGLEIGVSRSAIWCGEGRPCDFDTLLDILIGKDNADDGLSPDLDPSNQMAGIDFRWTNRWFGAPLSFYGQMIGEDEADMLPSNFLAQFGIEGSGISRDQTSFRWFVEWAATSCDAIQGTVRYGCGYRHTIYQSGYTYYRRIIGHSLDNDGRVISAGIVVVTEPGNTWHVLGRVGDVNRVGSDARHSVSIEPADLASVDIQHTRNTRYGRFDIGVGFERREDKATGVNTRDTRGYLQWQAAWGG